MSCQFAPDQKLRQFKQTTTIKLSWTVGGIIIFIFQSDCKTIRPVFVDFSASRLSIYCDQLRLVSKPMTTS